MIDGNLTYCGDNFTVNTNIESLHCTLETNVCQLNVEKKFNAKFKGLIF